MRARERGRGIGRRTRERDAGRMMTELGKLTLLLEGLHGQSRFDVSRLNVLKLTLFSPSLSSPSLTLFPLQEKCKLRRNSNDNGVGEDNVDDVDQPSPTGTPLRRPTRSSFYDLTYTICSTQVLTLLPRYNYSYEYKCIFQRSFIYSRVHRTPQRYTQRHIYQSRNLAYAWVCLP